jgi:hypothetical protein
MYRRFEINDYSNEFKITEIAPTSQHPMNWSGPVQRETAWAAATSQAVQPIVIKLLDGTVQEHVALNVFDLAAFEEAAYRGYVAYGYSMSDGGYYPIEREQWIKELRDETMRLGTAFDNLIEHHNDCRLSVKNSFGEYAFRLARSLAE